MEHVMAILFRGVQSYLRIYLEHTYTYDYHN